MLHKSALCLLLALPLAENAVAMAAAPIRDGVSFSFGGGLGLGSYDTANRAGDYLAPHLRLRAGYYTSPRLLLGVELSQYSLRLGESRNTGGYYSALVQWRPAADGRLFVQGSLGMLRNVETESLDTGPDREVFKGGGAGIGLGFEFRRRKRSSLSIYVNAVRSFGAEHSRNVPGVSASGGLYLIGLTYDQH